MSPALNLLVTDDLSCQMPDKVNLCTFMHGKDNSMVRLADHLNGRCTNVATWVGTIYLHCHIKSKKKYCLILGQCITHYYKDASRCMKKFFFKIMTFDFQNVSIFFRMKDFS